MRFTLGLTFALLVGVSLSACSANTHASPDASDAGAIEECEAFLTAYEHCLDSLGPADIARARVAQTRAGLAAQMSGDESARTAVRKTCASNLSQIKTTCR